MYPELRLVFMALGAGGHQPSQWSGTKSEASIKLNQTYHFREVEPFLICQRNFSCASSWRDGMGRNEQWAQQQVMTNRLIKLRQSAFMRPMLKADDLYNSVKRNRQTKNANLLWVHKSSFQTVLSICQRNGWTVCPLGIRHEYYLL